MLIAAVAGVVAKPVDRHSPAAAAPVGEALYEEIDAGHDRSNIDIEKHPRRAELKLAQPTPGLPWRGSWAGNGTTTAVGHAEHRSCHLHPADARGDGLEWTPEGWATTDLVAGLWGRASPTAPQHSPLREESG